MANAEQQVKFPKVNLGNAGEVEIVDALQIVNSQLLVFYDLLMALDAEHNPATYYADAVDHTRQIVGAIIHTL